MSNNHSTHLVRLVVNNDYDVYQQFVSIVRTIHWDEDEESWTGVDQAAKTFAAMVRELDPDAEGFSDLHKVDYDDVDYAALLLDEREERAKYE